MRLIKEKVFNIYYMAENKFPSIEFFIMTLTAVVIIFHDYICGKVFFIFKDFAGDSIQQIWPRLIYLSRSLADGYLPAWNFSNGLGVTGGSYNIFDYLAVVGGIDGIPYALSCLYIVKIVCGGFFFYKYSLLLGNNRSGAIISGFFYSFCGPMMLRGSWRGYPNEIMMAAILLYASENYVQGRFKRTFPLFVIAFSFVVDAYYVCFYVVIFSGYAFWRYFSKGWNKSSIRKFVQYEVAYFIGFLIGIKEIINLVYSMMNSGRFAYTQSDLSVPFIDLSDLPLDFMGSVSPGFFGTEDLTYTNILEGPEFYCGILTIVLIPQIFCLKNKRQKAWYIGMLMLIGVYCVCPQLRMLTAGGGRVAAYKASSFWIVLVLLTMFSAIWGNLCDKNVNRCLFNSTCFLVGIIYIICRCFLYTYELNKYDIYFSILLMSYCILINLYLRNRIFGKPLKIVIMCLCICEAVIYFYDIYNDRDVLTRNDLKEDVFYNYSGNSTNEIVKEIKSIEDELFYRMEQIYLPSNPCDSVAYGYYGIKGYTGGTGNSKYLVDFMRSVSIDDVESITLLHGWRDDVALNTLMSIKYILSSYDNEMYGYSFVGSKGNIQVYKNNNFLPLGYAYNKYMNYDEFISIPIENRGLALLEGCVLKDEELKQYAKPMDYMPYTQMIGFDEQIYQRNVDERKREVLDVHDFKNDYILGEITLENDGILSLTMPYDKGWKMWIDGEEYPTYCINNGLLGTYLSEGKHNVELKWTSPVQKYIIILTALGVVLYIAYWIYSARIDFKHTNEEGAI